MELTVVHLSFTGMMAHPESPDGQGPDAGGSGYDGGCGSTLAVTGFVAEFFGKAAHAGANPWAGINALDAAVSGCKSESTVYLVISSTSDLTSLNAHSRLDNAVNTLRQQIKPTERIHGIILGSEKWAQNVKYITLVVFPPISKSLWR